MASRLLWSECLLLNARRRWGFGVGSVPSEAVLRSILARQFHSVLPLQATTVVRMPSLSPTMTDGTIVSWSKKEGEQIFPGDVLCEIQTDKAVVALEFDEEGVFAKILVRENIPDVKVGTPIALWVEPGDDWKNVETPSHLGIEPVAIPGATISAGAFSPSKAASSAPPPPPAQGKPSANGPVGPAVKSNLSMYGLSAADIPTSGPKGILLKYDVIQFALTNKIQPVVFAVAAPSVPAGKPAAKPAAKPAGKPAAKAAAKPAPSNPYIDIEVTNMRKTIAKRLLQSKSTIPHAYGTIQCSIGVLNKLRTKLKNAGMKVSVNDFIIKSTGNALAKCPQVNVVWEGKEVKQKSQIDISVAVATPVGLITPIVTNVAERDVINISENIKALAGKARAGKLQPHEFMGGTFTISNLGMFGIHHFTAIINPPQCGILAIGGSTLNMSEKGEFDTMVSFSLSYDGQAITTEDAAKFLAHLKEEIEFPTETSMNIFDFESRVEVMEMLKEDPSKK